MTWDIFKVLFPTMLVHLALSLVVMTAVWFCLHKIQHTMQHKLVAFLAVAAGFSVWHSVNTLVELKQNQRLIEWRQSSQQAEAAAAQASLPGNNPNLTVGSEDELKVRQEYLKVLEQVVSNPQQLNEQVRQQIFNSFKGVYGNPQVLQFYKTNLVNFMLCSRAYVKDALDSMNQKKEVRSDDQKQCAAIAGEFFNRPKLLDDNFTTVYNAVITAAAERKPASQAKLPKLEELKASLERQEIGLKVVAFLFPN